MLTFTFLPPIVLTGLIFVSLLIALLAMPRQAAGSSDALASNVSS
jgi:hypothetical protein